jgi:hypothetical protein
MSQSERRERAEALLRQIGGADWDHPITRLAQTSWDFAELTIDYPYGDVLSRRLSRRRHVTQAILSFKARKMRAQVSFF